MADTPKFPNSYKDPYWSTLAEEASAKVGAPAGVLKAILLQGEKSNNDQVSSAGARTPFQITPTTRKLILDKYGVDPYLSPANAAEGAALLVKEASDRNKGDIGLTVREYHGGVDKKNWGPLNDAYANRVVGNAEAIRSNKMLSDFDNWATDQGFGTGTSAQSAQIKQIGADFDAAMAKKPDSVKEAPASPDVSAIGADFDQWQANQPAPVDPQPDLGFLGGIKEAITGTQRATPESQSLPEWTGMPEIVGPRGDQVFTPEQRFARSKASAGTILAGPEEITQIVKANFPGTDIRQDAKGNYIMKSSVDGKEYVIPPGMSVNDIPRVLAGLVAFTPAGRATTVAGSAVAAAGTQALIEGTQAATGGNFSAKDVALTGAVGGLVPPIMRGVEAVGGLVASPVKNLVNKALGREAAPIAEAAAPKGYVPPGQEPINMGAAPEYTSPGFTNPNVGRAAPITPMPAEDIAGVARKAALGDEKATQTLAEQAAPNAKTVQSAKNLGVEDYLQPDHVSTNQAFKEFTQMVKSVPTSQMAIAEKEGLSKVAKTADDLITKLGGTDDLAGVSQNVKNSLTKTQADLSTKAEGLYTQLKEGIPAKTEVQPTNVLDFVKQRAEDLGGAKNLSPLEKSIQSRLSGNPTYTLLDTVRKDIGAAARMSGPFKDADTGLAKRLYKAISQDQQVVAEAQGLGEVFQAAKSAVQLRKGLEDDLIALFGKNIDGSIVSRIGSATSALPKGDTSKFINLIKAIPDDMRQEVVASGLNTAFGKTAKNQAISFNSYANWYEGLLKNKQAYTALMTNLPPEARKSLSDLYRVSKGISEATKTKIATGRLTEGMKRLNSADTLGAKIFENMKYDLSANVAGTVAGTVASSVVGPVAGGGIGLAIRSALTKGARTEGAVAAEKLLMSPEFKQTVAAAARGQPEAAAKKLAKSVIFVDFVKKARIPSMDTLSARERWILQGLEANQQQR